MNENNSASDLLTILHGGKNMNKGDLINEVAKVVSTKKEAQAAVDCVFNAITKTLKKKGTVTLVGFGTFKVNKMKARTGRNPQTGEAIKIKAKNSPKFVAGKALKDAVK
jgi:nucleoid DNA-binding protein